MKTLRPFWRIKKQKWKTRLNQSLVLSGQENRYHRRGGDAAYNASKAPTWATCPNRFRRLVSMNAELLLQYLPIATPWLFLRSLISSIIFTTTWHLPTLRFHHLRKMKWFRSTRKVSEDVIFPCTPSSSGREQHPLLHASIAILHQLFQSETLLIGYSLSCDKVANNVFNIIAARL